jgi:hypothetical protein
MSERREVLKQKYLDIIMSFGFKVIYDLDKECNHELYDLYMLLMRKDKSRKPSQAKRYAFLAITHQSPLSLDEFEMHLPGEKKESEFEQFKAGIRNRLLEYGIDDVIAILLHSGYHLMDVYEGNATLSKVKFTPEMIQLLIEYGNAKGSPLEIYTRKKNAGRPQRP